MEWSGNGMEWSGVEWRRVEWSGVGLDEPHYIRRWVIGVSRCKVASHRRMALAHLSNLPFRAIFLAVNQLLSDGAATESVKSAAFNSGQWTLRSKSGLTV